MKDTKLLLKVLQNIASKEETKTFFEECEKNNEQKEEYLKLKNLWTLSVSEISPNKKQNFEQFWKKANKQSKFKLRKLYVEVARYAAIVIVSISIGILFYHQILPKDETGIVQSFTSEKGSISSINLTDGSRIWLNTGSEIIFDKKSVNQVYATLKGEAFFEIIHNPNREFIVDVNGFQIKDLGTKFNVQAYEQDDEIVATLIEGEIELSGENLKSVLAMNPKDQFSYNRLSRKYKMEQVNANIISAWTEGKFVFIDKTLDEICRELERWYDVKIEINDDSIKNERFTSVVKRSTPIVQMLELLKATSNLNYEIHKMDNAADRIYIN